ncbi:uncharacterized protein ColSpa_10146 [Colletotrichum spaethianum]|uniref:Uncharacterized protein n=1 Tax=Colletotrichum spaethianum TaxID=700344 RepID=A0AA37UP47_9PEZI|nr:uncharacterized protein ColSpa_10146 [Colletotrichum spaethianum]GKT49965.1 hypothetical protein ColSpa_10146 [Colletotrichum spaethianum]
MAPTPLSSAYEAPKLPASADFNALYNRISLASAKQATFLTSMRAKYPSLARSPAPSPATAPATNGAFSSLTKPDPSSAPAAAAAAAAAPRKAQDDDLRFENPNTGLGYSAPKSEQVTSAATRDLSRRLLGTKRGRTDDPKAAAAALAKRRLQDDESEEEEGRSGVGRSKKKRVRQESPEARSEPSPAPPLASEPEGTEEKADVEMHEGGSAPAGALENVDGGRDTAQVDVEQEEASGSAEDAATPVDPARPGARLETGETSKKRKKKNRNKKNKAAAAAAASSGKEDS